MNIKKQFLVWGMVAGLVVPVVAKEKHHEKADDDDGDQKIELASTPAPVQATVAANLAQGKVEEVEVETEDGATTYEAKIKLPDGKELELKIAADGKLLKSKVEKEEDDDEKEGSK